MQEEFFLQHRGFILLITFTTIYRQLTNPKKIKISQISSDEPTCKFENMNVSKFASEMTLKNNFLKLYFVFYIYVY